MGMWDDNIHGLVLELSSSVFIGSSFIIKKKACLQNWNQNSGNRGDCKVCCLCLRAPAILATPLGALSIIFSAVLAYFILGEKLHEFGVLGCVLCVVGSTSIVLHAPKERDIESFKQLDEIGLILYSCIVVVSVLMLIYRIIPRCGLTHMVVYIGVCSLMGSLTVMSVKAVSIALKLTFSGMHQFMYFETWLFTIIVIVFCLTQINYMNKALTTFNTAIVSPVYYVMFTTSTILASMIMCKIVAELCGFITILSGTFLLHKTKDMGNDYILV